MKISVYVVNYRGEMGYPLIRGYSSRYDMVVESERWTGECCRKMGDTGARSSVALGRKAV